MSDHEFVVRDDPDWPVEFTDEDDPETPVAKVLKPPEREPTPQGTTRARKITRRSQDGAA